MSSLKRLRLPLLTVLFLCTVIALTSCSKKDVVSDEPIMSGAVDSGGESAAAYSEGSSEAVSGGGADGLQTVYFDYDQYNIRGDARSSLEGNADWLRSNSSATVQIEGHCDERGTIEYNLALGERRANAARRYLQRLGIDASRMSTISYGEERPANSGSGDNAWAENRRAEFVILSQ